MYDKILVPLDGSKTAEIALPFARLLAEKLDAEVELLEVIDLAGMARAVPDQFARDIRERAERSTQYLNEVAKSFPRNRTRSRVERGTPAEVIIDAAAGNKDTLVIMASHGRSGIQRWLLGSVAEKVLRGTSNPLLLIRAAENAPADGQAGLKSIVVPLDGSKVGELALLPALELARSLKIDMVLAGAYELPAGAYYRGDDYPASAAAFIPSYTELVEAMSQETRQYIDSKVKELSAQAPPQVRGEILEGPPAERIIDLAQSTKDSLIVMCTHGRSGIGRWMLGSIAEKVARHAENPVLIIRGR